MSANGRCGQISYRVGIKELSEYVWALSLLLLPISLYSAAALAGSAIQGQGFLLLLFSAIPLMLAHELFHVVAAKMVGSRKVHVFFYAERRLLAVGLAFRLPEPVPLGRWYLVALAPLAFLTPLLAALGLLSGNPLRPLAAGMLFWNILGSAGDLILATVTVGAPRTALIVDMGTSFSLSSKPSLVGWLAAESTLALLLAVAAALLAAVGSCNICAAIAAPSVFALYMLVLGRRRAERKLEKALKLP